MFCSFNLCLFIVFSILNSVQSVINLTVSAKNTKVWGPGLKPHIFTMPARYFFIQATNTQNESIPVNLGEVFDVSIEGSTKDEKPCRVWTNQLNRKHGSYIIRYKLYEPCHNFVISIKYEHEHVAGSPYKIPSTVYPDDCDCPNQNISKFLKDWECGPVPEQIIRDLKPFKTVDWSKIRAKVIKEFNQPHSVSLCHYVVKKNLIHRTCYGKYVGFKMFMDSILLSLSRKMQLPDVEFFVNLGDWPLVKKQSESLPIFSWCGSATTRDIVMPTYDITESTLENMGRVMLDMLSVQGNVKHNYQNRIGKAFWRGRDSNQHRLDLIDIARRHPELFNASLTNFFFFRDKQDLYGPKTDHISFFDFFDYKYQLAIDGTVAAYRFPYLLAGGSLTIKQESPYYEHFYNDLIPNTHYVSIKRDLSDIVDKVKWALNNDKEAQTIALNGQKFANDNLLPQHIFCYYTHLLNEFSHKIVNEIHILDNMEKVTQNKQHNHCNCMTTIKDEL